MNQSNSYQFSLICSRKSIVKKTKVLIDGEEVTLKDYQGWLLEKLDIPIVHDPKG